MDLNTTHRTGIAPVYVSLALASIVSKILTAENKRNLVQTERSAK